MERLAKREPMDHPDRARACGRATWRPRAGRLGEGPEGTRGEAGVGVRPAPGAAGPLPARIRRSARALSWCDGPGICPRLVRVGAGQRRGGGQWRAETTEGWLA
jgi:hypothetical protein